MSVIQRRKSVLIMEDLLSAIRHRVQATGLKMAFVDAKSYRQHLSHTQNKNTIGKIIVENCKYDIGIIDNKNGTVGIEFDRWHYGAMLVPIVDDLVEYSACEKLIRENVAAGIPRESLEIELEDGTIYV